MKVLVAGGYGFIGRGVVEALIAAGHEVTGAGRDTALGRRLVPQIDWISCDFNNDLNPDIWTDRLTGFDAVVNCVGILQTDLRDDASLVHSEGARALFIGAEVAKVSRFIHVSATTVVEDSGDEQSEYSASKLSGERCLAETKLNWTIVRPDLVLGRGSAGGVALMQGLAALPFIVPLPAVNTDRKLSDGRLYRSQLFQPISLSDLADGIVGLLERSAFNVGDDEAVSEGAVELKDVDDYPFNRTIIYGVGPKVVSLKEIILSYRHWLGFGRALVLIIPRGVMWPIMWLGDLASLVGNRGPVRSTSLKQMDLFEEHDARPFAALLGRPVAGLNDFLAGQPSTAIERQSARIFFLLPFLRWVMGFSWIFEGYETAQQGLENAVAELPGTVLGDLIFSGDTALYLQMFVALLLVLSGVMFLSKPWMRVGGFIKIVLLLVSGVSGFAYVGGAQSFVGWGLSFMLPIMTILLLMGLHEKR